MADSAQQQALKKTRAEYDSLRADLLQFKQNKVGTLLDEGNLDVQARISALALQRQLYINQMKNTKNRENETLARLKQFQNKIRTAKKEARDSDDDEEGKWMRTKLRFHVDSQRAYDVDKAQQYSEKAGGKFEDFLAGGDANKKYANAYTNVKRPDLGDDMIQGMNVDEVVSMKELIDLAVKNKDKAN